MQGTTQGGQATYGGSLSRLSFLTVEFRRPCGLSINDFNNSCDGTNDNSHKSSESTETSISTP